MANPEELFLSSQTIKLKIVHVTYSKCRLLCVLKFFICNLSCVNNYHQATILISIILFCREFHEAFEFSHIKPALDAKGPFTLGGIPVVSAWYFTVGMLHLH